MQHAAMWKKKYSEIANAYNQTKMELAGGNFCVISKSDLTSVKCNRMGNRYSNKSRLSPEFVEKFVSHFKVVAHCGQTAYGESRGCTNYTFKWTGVSLESTYSYYGSLAQGQGQAGMPKPWSTGTVGGLSMAEAMASKAVLLADGSVMYFGGYATGLITVDINGFNKGPNALGRDLFAVMVNEDWLKPVGATGTFNTGANGSTCTCSKNSGCKSAQSIFGSTDLLNGTLLSGACCSATKLMK
jgi:hypothetical protein